MTIDAELSLENENELISTWVRNKTAAGGELVKVALWTERNRQRWVPEFRPAFQACTSETQITKCEDEEMNFETGTSWVTTALDMYLCTGVRPPAAHGGRRGLGTVKAWAKSIAVLWKDTRWKDMERREEERKRVKNDVTDLGFAGLKACGGLRDHVCIHQADRVASEILDLSQRVRVQHGKKKEIVPGKPDNPPMTQRVRACFAARAQTGTSQPSRRKVQGFHAANCTNQTQMQTAQQGNRCGKQKTLRDGGEGGHEMQRTDEAFR